MMDHPWNPDALSDLATLHILLLKDPRTLARLVSMVDWMTVLDTST